MAVKSVPVALRKVPPPKARERILAGARACFARLGIDKATIVDIAEEAGYSRPVIYKHFHDKADIVDCVCLEEMQALQQALNRRIARNQPFDALLTDTIVEAVILAHGNIYIQRFMQDRETWVRAQTEAGQVHLWVRDRWTSFLERGRAEGLLAPDLELAQCVSWIAMVQSLLLLRFASEDIDRAALHALVSRFVVRPLVMPAG